MSDKDKVLPLTLGPVTGPNGERGAWLERFGRMEAAGWQRDDDWKVLKAVTAERDRLLRVIELVADPENYNGSYRLPANLRSMAQQALAQKG